MAIDLTSRGTRGMYGRRNGRHTRIIRRTVKARRKSEKRFGPSLHAPFTEALAFAALRATLRPVHDLWRGLPVVIALDLPEGVGLEAIKRALGRLDHGIARGSGSTARTLMSLVTPEASANRKRRPGASPLRREVLDDLRTHRRVIILIEEGTPIPPDVIGLIDHRLPLERPTAAQIAGLTRRMLGVTLGPETIAELSELSLGKLELVLRDGASLGQIERRLRQLRSVEASAAGDRDAGPTMLDLPGMGAAADWGLDLAQDLKDWSAGALSWRDVDRGLLLVGKPGTGKTTYAKALAKTCGVPLIAGSIARWQAAGHLGDMLGAMRRAFEEAIQKAPSILFIDEIDSVGDRASFSGDNRGYQTEVVNGLLECLDGVDGREGVVVIGACNDADGIDPAVTRSGRLDRTIEIPLPDGPARTAILRLHLRAPLHGEDLSGIVQRTEGWTGADLERIAREARRRARKARRPMTIADLHGSLPDLRTLAGHELQRMAIHEAGHAVVASVLGNRSIDRVWIEKQIPTGDGSGGAIPGGAMRLRPHPGVVRTDADRLTEIAVLLAGMAAEEVILGTRSEGASGGPGSDLYRATVLAARFEMQSGFGSTLVHLAPAPDEDLLKGLAAAPDLRRRVERRLAGRYAAAKEIVAANEQAILMLGTELVETPSVAGDRVSEIVRNCGGASRGALSAELLAEAGGDRSLAPASTP